MKDKYTGVIIADVHFGAIDDKRLLEELQNGFIQTLDNMSSLDFVIIDGDLFHKKLSLSDNTSWASYYFLNAVCMICVEKRAKLRIVYGTDSHEWNQYRTFFGSICYDKLDYDIIYHARDEELFPDVNVLYLPEEQIQSKDEYYSEYFNNEKYYNFVFGHGVVREAMREASVSLDNKSARKKVPVFSTAEFFKICKGQTFFGHYHVNTSFMDAFYYVGSYTRWQFGEETPKGFYITEFDTIKDSYKATFIENKMAEKYVTFSYGYQDNVFKSLDQIEGELDRVDGLITNNTYDHIRYEFNIPEDHDNPEAYINYLKERYKFNDKIKVNVVNGYVEAKREKSKENIRERQENFGFIRDKSIPMNEKVSLYLDATKEAEIKSERVAMYMDKDVNQIFEQLCKELPEDSEEDD